MSTQAKAAMGSVLGICDLTPATGAIDAAEIGAGGSGYDVDDVVTVVQSGGSGGTFTVSAVDSAGGVTELTRLKVGTGYAVATGLTTTVSPAGGTGLQIDITSLLTLVGECSDISVTKPKPTRLDATNHDSPAASSGAIYEEFVSGVMEGGEISITANHVPGDTGQAQLASDGTGTQRDYEIIDPTGFTISFTGQVHGPDYSLPVKGLSTMTAKIETTGEVTCGSITATASA